MTYPKQLTNQAELVLAPFLPRLKTLGEGESLVLEDSTEAIDTLRYYIYSWLHINSLKEIYSLRKETPTTLRILRKAIPDPKIVSVQRLSNAEEFVQQHLLDTETWDEAQIIVTKAIETGELSGDYLVEVMDEWRRINGL